MCSRPDRRMLKAIVERERPDLVLMGKQAVDDDANQTGQFLAALLDWSQATFVSRLELLAGEIRVDRETDHGIETIRLPLPAVVTTDLRLNEPRYASLAGIMKAKKKPLDVVHDEELGVPFEPRVQVLQYRSTDTKRRCERVATVDELIDRIAATAKI
jgi:electron transfer flavoprotein beta subunit